MDRQDVDRLEHINVSEKERKPTLQEMFFNTAIPLLKALAIIILFLISGKGYSPFGCKTQYLFTDKFWYNKQLVIFFTIYFVINLRAQDYLTTRSPFATFIISIITWIAFNLVGTLGNTWWKLSIPGYPSPLTWFGLVAFFLVFIYVIDDIRRYYRAIEETEQHQKLIGVLYRLELVLVALIVGIIIVGFHRAYAEKRKQMKGSFDFTKFFFGAPVGGKSCPARYASYRREIQRSVGKGRSIRTGVYSFVPWLAVLGSVLFAQWALPQIVDARGGG